MFIEDNENFVVINKPPGISVQSGTKSRRNIIDILRDTKEFENSIDKVNKLKLDIGEKNSEISKINNILDEIYDELMQIKTNILVNKDE